MAEMLSRTQELTDNLQMQFEVYLQAKPKTRETYMKALRQFYAWMSCSGIRRPAMQDVITWRDALAEEKKPTTVNVYLTAVKLFFQFLQDAGIYPDVAGRVKRVKSDSRYHKRDALTAEQVQGILTGIDRDSLKGKRDFAMILLMATAGLRDIEVVNASVEDLRTVRGSTVLFLQGKGYSENNAEFVKVGRKAERALRDYLHTRKAKAGEALFASVANRAAGQRMTTRSVSRICKSAMIGAGYESDRLTAHSLRHTAATLALLGGEDIRNVQQQLRHTNVNTTLVYAHDLSREANSCSETAEKALADLYVQ